MLSTPQIARGLPINRDFAPSKRERKPHQTSDFLGRFFAVRTGRGASSESSVRTACRLAFPSQVSGTGRGRQEAIQLQLAGRAQTGN